MSHVPYTPPPPGPPQRKGMSPVVIVLLTLGTVLVLAVAGGLVYAGTRPKPVTITGSVTINSNIDGGTTCRGTDGFEDIREGASVVVRDSAGKVIATDQLTAGSGQDLATSQIALSCRLDFTVRDVPRRKFYTIEVSHRGSVTFTAAQVDSGDVQLSLGS